VFHLTGENISHSRLPSNQYSSKGKTIKEPNLIAEAGRGLLTASTRYTGTRGNMRQGGDARAMSFAKIRTSAVRKAEGIMKATRTSPADVVRTKPILLFPHPNFGITFQGFFV
jgi:hypothetical protein